MSKNITIRVHCPQGIALKSWLNSPEYEEFRAGYAYASTQTRAIPAMSAISAEAAYFLWWAINRGAEMHGHRQTKSEPSAPALLAALKGLLDYQGTGYHADYDMLTYPKDTLPAKLRSARAAIAAAEPAERKGGAEV